ncbi:hypothetical protein [Azospirillum argentinense]|uniref:hypothetical protein n=1 Tax=Azospirillum argentinense TaxID=2970906 RepID=UPI0032DFD472
MRIVKTRGRDEIRRLREAAYLELWPPAQQLEALQDAANGQPDKKACMEADFAAIKERLPYPDAQ